MKKFSLELPKFRLELHAKLVKRRKPLVEDPFVPTLSVVNKKYRSGTLLGKIARHLSGHKNTKKFFAANLSALAIVGILLPGTQASVQAASFNTQLDETVIQTQNTLKTEKSIQYPLENVKVNQGFSIFHLGVDLGAEIGDSIKPIKAGMITEAGYANDGYGNTILIDHGRGLTSRYAHLSKIEVKVGDQVTTNTEIGEVGTTGQTTGPHLHLEIHQNGIPLNPLSVLPR
jgi:murein DD-endopeptidase MepM/ murein hydrolase activator NlpD